MLRGFVVAACLLLLVPQAQASLVPDPNDVGELRLAKDLVCVRGDSPPRVQVLNDCASGAASVDITRDEGGYHISICSVLMNKACMKFYVETGGAQNIIEVFVAEEEEDEEAEQTEG